jgi:hypothetical protein
LIAGCTIGAANSVKSLNEVFSSRSARRRYEVWFVRLGLADGAGAWWFRYLLMNPGRDGCAENLDAMPVQVWATWFPREGKPQSLIQGFSLENLQLSARGKSPFLFRVGHNAIGESSCQGALRAHGHTISWELEYRSTFRATLSDKGWIGFSRTPHSDALFSGQIMFDGHTFRTQPLGFGVQGHNCGHRHRHFWRWAHAYFERPPGPPSTLEALVYEMPLGLLFRKAVLWHETEQHVFRDLRDIKKERGNLEWNFRCARDGFQLDALFDGSGANLYCLPYVKTDCTGSFEVANNSLARAVVCFERRARPVEKLETRAGAVLEMGGR